MFYQFEQWMIAAGGHWWSYLALFVPCFIDGVLPILPSETLLVTLGSLSASTGKPFILGIIAVGWAGAFLGDHLAYFVGRLMRNKQKGVFRFKRLRKVMETVEGGLERRAFTYLLTARFIPLGRTAVNLAAGAAGYPLASFSRRVFFAAGIWASFSTLIGAFAGSWFHSHPLLGIIVALVVAIVVSLAVENAIRRIERIFAARRAASELQ